MFWTQYPGSVVPLAMFNLKNELQEYGFLFCAKCVFVTPIFTSFIGALSAWANLGKQLCINGTFPALAAESKFNGTRERL